MSASLPPPDHWIARLLNESVLFDTMIIRHLCEAGAGTSLAAAFAGRILWPDAVNAELSLQARGRPLLAEFLAKKPAVVLEIDAADEDEVEDIRIDMYSKKAARESDTQHLGEAQCLFFAERDGHPLATDDGAARWRARAGWDSAKNAPRAPNKKRVDVFHVVDVIQVMVRTGACKPGPGWDFYDRAVITGLTELKGFPRPASRDRFLADASAMWALFKRDAAAAAHSSTADEA